MPREYNYVTGKPKHFLPTVPLAESVYDAALGRMRQTYARFDHVAVMFSGGKDSTACLQIALTVARETGRLPLRVIHFDEEAIPLQTEAYVRRVAANPDIALEWFCIPHRHRNACSRESPWWYPWAPEARDRWVRPLPPEGITTLAGFPAQPELRYDAPSSVGLFFDPQKYGTVAEIMGIRADESVTRRRAVTRRQHDNYIVPVNVPTSMGNIWKVYPIYDWRTEDVWTAPKTFGWDYNRAYDVLDQAGVSPSKQRCSPAYGEEPLEKLWTYQTCFPELWDRMVERVPGAAAAVRYARTELWSYRSGVAKPDGMSWQELIAYYISKFDPASRRQIAARIKGEIDAHYSKTGDPIVSTARHPDTGISWQWLATVAMRGDLKGRRQAGIHMYAENMPRMWAEYNAERATEEGAIPDAAE